MHVTKVPCILHMAILHLCNFVMHIHNFLAAAGKTVVGFFLLSDVYVRWDG